MDYAILEIQGQQFSVNEGKWILTPFLKEFISHKNKDESKEKIIVFDKVLFLKKDSKSYFGDPYVKNVKIQAQILDPMVKSSKITVFKYKRSKRVRRKQGHRIDHTKIKVEKIEIQN